MTFEERHDRPPDDFAEDVLREMADLDAQDAGIPGTVLVSTALGPHGPRVRWYPGRAGRTLPCLIVSFGPDPAVRDDVVRSPASKAAAPEVVAWVRVNHAALLDVWANGASWNRREVSASLDGLQKSAVTAQGTKPSKTIWSACIAACAR